MKYAKFCQNHMNGLGGVYFTWTFFFFKLLLAEMGGARSMRFETLPNISANKF